MPDPEWERCKQKAKTMSEISLSSSMKNSLLSLQNTQGLYDQTQERLVSGKRVNNPVDDPANYYAAATLTNRANALEGRIDGMAQAVQSIKAADNGIEAMKSILESMQAVAESAMSSAEDATEERQALGIKYNELLVQLESFANDSAYGGINLLKGEQTQTVQLGEKFGDSTFTVEGFHVEGASDVDDNGDVDPVDTTKIPDSWGDDGKADAAGYAFVVNSVQDPTNVTGIKSYSDLTDAQSDYNDFNEQLDAAKAAASSGDQDAYDTAYQAAYEEAVSYASNSGITFTYDDTSGSETFSYTPALTSGSDAETRADAMVAALNKMQEFTDVTLTVPDDANPTTATVSTNAGSDMTATTSVTALSEVDDTQDALIAADPGTISRVDWSDSVNYRTDLTAVLEGIEQVGDMLDTRAKLLSYDQSTISLREDYTSEFVLALEDGSDKLTSADMNEEAANLLALQTSQQLGVQGLSLANQQTQNILQILG